MVELADQNIHKPQYINHNNQEQVEIICFTDPLCCWSWAAEPSWFRLRSQFENINWRYVMGGLISNMQFSKANISLQQTGPIWLQSGQKTSVPMKFDMWHKDPPTSSYPACIAVKCAKLQSDKAAELYLNYAREAVMTRGLNIAKTDILFRIAKTLERDATDIFNYDRFDEDWRKGAGCDSFCEDIKFVRAQNIERFPTLIIRGGKKEVRVVGYRSYAEILESFEKIIPVLNNKY